MNRLRKHVGIPIHNHTFRFCSDRPTPHRVSPPLSLLTAKHVRVSAFIDGNEPLGFGTVLGSVEEDVSNGETDVFRVRFDSTNLGVTAHLDLATTVWVLSTDRASSGYIAKVRGDGTYSVLFDDGRFEAIVSRDRIVASEGKSAILQTEKCKNITAWLMEAGVDRRGDAELASLVLCKAGWRKEKLYLLKLEDVALLQHLHRSARACILEVAEWELESVRVARDRLKEKEKEESWSYFIVKYAGVVSATFASFGVCSVFLWNYLNYRRTRRFYQMSLAVDHLTADAKDTLNFRVTQSIPRPEDEDRFKATLRGHSESNPVSLVMLGSRGNGKSTIVRRVFQERKGVVYVGVRIGWKHDDLTRAVVRALGVESTDTIGDLTTFMMEALRKAAAINGALPTIVYAVRIGDNPQENQDLVNAVFNQQRYLSHDLKIASTISEVDDTRVNTKPSILHELTVFRLGEFTKKQAKERTRGIINESQIHEFEKSIGLSPNMLDQAVALAESSRMTPNDFIEKCLVEAGLTIQSFRQCWKTDSVMFDVLTHLSHSSYQHGVGLSRYPLIANRADVPNEVFHIDWTERMIKFNSKALHTAAQSMLN
eukprot:PhF_6_TR2193/c0_g2_i1/m.3632